MELNPLEVTGLRYSYNKYPVLDGIELKVEEGEILGILGPNGCGKTTLLKNLNKNLSPDGGCVMLDGTDLETIAKKDIARTRILSRWSGGPPLSSSRCPSWLLSPDPYRRA